MQRLDVRLTKDSGRTSDSSYPSSSLNRLRLLTLLARFGAGSAATCRRSGEAVSFTFSYLTRGRCLPAELSYTCWGLTGESDPFLLLAPSLTLILGGMQQHPAAAQTVTRYKCDADRVAENRECVSPIERQVWHCTTRSRKRIWSSRKYGSRATSIGASAGKRAGDNIKTFLRTITVP